MALAFIPQPHHVMPAEGVFRMPAAATVAIGDHTLFALAQEAAKLFKKASIVTALSGRADTLTIGLGAGPRQGGYRLTIGSQGIDLQADSVNAAWYGLQTLLQVAAQSPAGALPAMRIDDWPDFEDRGLYYDLARGRVPKIERLLELADTLAHYKINQLQLYIEHTFTFRNHPDIGKDASGLTAQDILQLDELCRRRGIELVPSLASFGHLASVLCHKQYHELAEDWGVGKYLDPETAKKPAWQIRRGWSLAPANPKVYEFLDSLFGEFLPCFSSGRFNVCCDETWDLGLGQSYELARKIGKGRVYLGHIVKLNELTRKYGKRMMFWGDIVREHPELIPEIPKDAIVLDWGYSYNHNFAAIADFKKANLDFYACPGTSSWVTLFPRLTEATENITRFAAAGKAAGAKGLLNTDWGDGGHYNFMELSWHGYLLGAEQAWNVSADASDFTARFCKLFLRSGKPALAAAIDELGEIASLSMSGYYQAVWRHVYFACPGEALFDGVERPGTTGKDGKMTAGPVRLTAALGKRTLARLAAIRKHLAAAAAPAGADPHKILPYWLFAIDTLMHAAKKLTVLAADGKDTPAARKALKREMSALMARFKKLWLARNRTSEIRVTLEYYAKALAAL